MMLERILPRRLDNTYRGQTIAIWIFVALLLMKTGIALGTIFNGHDAAQRADGIPLDSFGVAGAHAVLTLFAMWGLSQLVFSVFGVLALIRWRALIPFMFVLLLVEHLARRWILLVMPIVRSGTSPSVYINLVILPILMIAGVVLSLWPRAEREEGKINFAD